MQMQRTKAYSYIRLSSEEQLAGDGETRQVEMRDAFVAERGLDLDDTLRDLGVSAFDGSNRERGALGIFLKKVRAGEVPRGSYLLVESLDRLSRDHVLKAFRVFHDLLEAGIVIATLGDDRVYSEETIQANWTDLIISLAVMSRAHEGSASESPEAPGGVGPQAPAVRSENDGQVPGLASSVRGPDHVHTDQEARRDRQPYPPGARRPHRPGQDRPQAERRRHPSLGGTGGNGTEAASRRSRTTRP
jgi:hypothetical protein